MCPRALISPWIFLRKEDIMVNSDPVWIYFGQKLQSAVEGEEVKTALLNCLQNLDYSHTSNMADKSDYYAELIWWDPGDPHTPDPPPGWSLDPDGRWIFDGRIQGG